MAIFVLILNTLAMFIAYSNDSCIPLRHAVRVVMRTVDFLLLVLIRVGTGVR